MKKLLLIAIFSSLVLFSCNKENPTLIIENTAKIAYGLNEKETNQILTKGGFYKKSTLEHQELVELLTTVDIFKSALENFPHRTTVQTYTTQFSGVTLPVIAFFDQDQLFAQFVPLTTMSREKFDNFIEVAHSVLGESVDEVSDNFLQYYWSLNDSNSVFQIAYNVEESSFIMLFINYNIRMENDLAIFKAVEPTNEWFLAGELGNTYSDIESKEKNLYASSPNQDTLMYMAKLQADDTPIFYIYFFDDAIVETILFQNIDDKEELLATIFSNHFNLQPTVKNQTFGENFTRTSYAWELDDNKGAFIIIESLTADGEMVQKQSSAFITRDYAEINNQM